MHKDISISEYATAAYNIVTFDIILHFPQILPLQKKYFRESLNTWKYWINLHFTQEIAPHARYFQPILRLKVHRIIMKQLTSY